VRGSGETQKGCQSCCGLTSTGALITRRCIERMANTTGLGWITNRRCAVCVWADGHSQGHKLSTLMRVPPAPAVGDHVRFEHFWLEAGPLERPDPSIPASGRFVQTPTVRQHLANLARAVMMRKYPVLLQGPTSAGKTSLVEYVAVQTGHRFVRLNNHEHTDLQEYLGRCVCPSDLSLALQGPPYISVSALFLRDCVAARKAGYINVVHLFCVRVACHSSMARHLGKVLHCTILHQVHYAVFALLVLRKRHMCHHTPSRQDG
jgi:hypothetical protein